MNVIARLEYELAYYDYAVQRFNHYTTRTPLKRLKKNITTCFCFLLLIFLIFSINLEEGVVANVLDCEFEVSSNPNNIHFLNNNFRKDINPLITPLACDPIDGSITGLALSICVCMYVGVYTCVWLRVDYRYVNAYVWVHKGHVYGRTTNSAQPV